MENTRKWVKELHAWIDGETIEYNSRLDGTGTWHELRPFDDYPFYARPWWVDMQSVFRIKPKPIVKYEAVYNRDLDVMHNTPEQARKSSALADDVVRLEFDPETKKLLKAEVV